MSQASGLIAAAFILISGAVGMGVLAMSLRTKSVRTLSAESSRGLETA